jgi:1-acyl-sn-glycerol-3-phosphate acyltransferase
MVFLRSLLFNIYFILITFLISTLCLPFAFSGLCLEMVGRFWAYSSLFGLRWICGIKMRVIGRENIPAGPFLVASKHQSAIETIVFWIIFRRPIYILKQELTKIPLYGIYLIKMGMIAIDRKSGSRSLKQIITKSLEAFSNNGRVIIFPEGTRTSPGVSIKHKIGVSNIYEKANVPVVPVALNTGYFWPSRSFLKYRGEFIIHILPPIYPGLPRGDFEILLYDTIERACKNLS